MTLLVDGLGYVALGCPDIEDATAFFTDICQMEVSETRPDTVFLRGDARHHWLRLERRDEPGFLRVGYAARSRQSRDEIRRRLAARDIETAAGGTLAEDRIVDGFRFRDPNGIEVEIYEEMAEMPGPPRPTGIELETLLHAVFDVEDVVATRDFWTDVLDFRRSDQIEELACFMRCGNRYHHSVGFLRRPGDGGRLDHVCVLVPSIDDVMRIQNHAKRAMVPMEHEVLRHAASGSIGSYLQYPPLGMGIEYCTGHGQLEDEDPGRLLVASPSTVDIWKALPAERPGGWSRPEGWGARGRGYDDLETQAAP